MKNEQRKPFTGQTGNKNPACPVFYFPVSLHIRGTQRRKRHSFFLTHFLFLKRQKMKAEELPKILILQGKAEKGKREEGANRRNYRDGDPDTGFEA